ncbi:MAG: hypothetical protein M1816_007790 [Peltula sp. TS41687]|nr:MAG: hypothetical protein M1816_007790 [Peltula sp. TS41687]
MQEHIRRAHPAYYISKLPATEESFALMVNSSPSDRPRESKGQGVGPVVFGHERSSIYGEETSPPQNNTTANNNNNNNNNITEDYPSTSLQPIASAAAALAQLHGHKLESDWDSEPETMSENDIHYRPNKAGPIELPGIAQMKQQAGILMSPYDPARPRHLLPSILSKSPPGRSSTLPPIQRREKISRPRKSSVSQNARKPQHVRKGSRGEHIRRMSYDGRKAFSAEPSGIAPAMGKRWEDLIDAATSATEDVDGDRTPISRSPPNPHRASLPPFSTAFPHSYQASPLQNALTPPTYGPSDPHPHPLPSVETAETGAPYPPTSSESVTGRPQDSVEDSSPSQSQSHNVRIYCAACQNATLLRSAYACTECICGICRECVDALVSMSEQRSASRSRCPRCGTVGGKFRPFQLEFR